MTSRGFPPSVWKVKEGFLLLRTAFARRLDHLLGIYLRTVSICAPLALCCCCLNFLGKFPHEQACNECQWLPARAAGSSGAALPGKAAAGSVQLLEWRTRQPGQEQGLQSNSLKKNEKNQKTKNPQSYQETALWRLERGQGGRNALLLLGSWLFLTWTFYTSPSLSPAYKTVTAANVTTPHCKVLCKLLIRTGYSTAWHQPRHSHHSPSDTHFISTSKNSLTQLFWITSWKDGSSPSPSPQTSWLS